MALILNVTTNTFHKHLTLKFWENIKVYMHVTTLEYQKYLKLFP